MKQGVGLLLVVACLYACGDDDAAPPPPAGAGGSDQDAGGTGGVGGSDTDAQVPDSGTDSAEPPSVGTLTLVFSDVEDMSGKNILIDILDSTTLESIAGACAAVTSDAFSANIDVTRRVSPALCDYSTDTGVPVGDYVVSVTIQEPEIFPGVLCATTSASVQLQQNTEVMIDSLGPCSFTMVPEGTFSGTPLRCQNESTRIAHTSLDAAASLLDFDGTTISAVRTGNSWVETYEDADCQLQVTRTILSDTQPDQTIVFGFMSRTFEWTPSDCTFTVSAGGDSMEIGSDYAFYEQDGAVRADDVWQYMWLGNNFTFTSVARVWEVVMPPLDLPCSTDAGFRRQWTLR